MAVAVEVTGLSQPRMEVVQAEAEAEVEAVVAPIASTQIPAVSSPAQTSQAHSSDSPLL